MNELIIFAMFAALIPFAMGIVGLLEMLGLIGELSDPVEWEEGDEP